MVDRCLIDFWESNLLIAVTEVEEAKHARKKKNLELGDHNRSIGSDQMTGDLYTRNRPSLFAYIPAMDIL